MIYCMWKNMSSSPKHLEYQTQKRRILIDVPFLLQKNYDTNTLHQAQMLE